MSEKANKVRIGAFVIGALALLLIAVAVLSSGQLFSTTLRFVMFFESSIKGLAPGSSVVFRGVPIGRVSDIRMSGDVNTLEFFFPVYVELDTSLMKNLKNIAPTPYVDAPYMETMIQNGFRASLNSQSLLTGQLLIELDFVPKAHQRSTYMPMQEYDSLLVIPTVPSQLDETWNRLAELPIPILVQKLVDIAEKIDTALEGQALKRLPENLDSAVVEARYALSAIGTAVESFNRLTASLAAVADMVDEQTPETLAHARRLMSTYISLAGQLEQSLERVRGVVGPNTATVIELTRAIHEIGETAKAANRLVGQFELSLESVRGVVGPNTVTMIEIIHAIREVGEAAKAVRSLAGTLERNPESLLMGKGANR